MESSEVTRAVAAAASLTAALGVAADDEQAGLFAAVRGDALVPGPDARIAPTRYEDWLKG